MKRLLVLLSLWLAAAPALAELRVFACEPEWAALARAIGGERVEVTSATTARQDPHHIEARPGLIAQVRRADLLVCTGADLEAGWLPLLVRQSGNERVRPGQPGYFEAAMAVERLEIPQQVDRSMGDVHAQGNPHVQLDPRRIATIAGQVAERLTAIDPAGADAYHQHLTDFRGRWDAAVQGWQARAAVLRSARFVTHHKDFAYLFDWLNLTGIGTLEPKPGLPPSPTHLAELKAQVQKQPIRAVLYAAYQEPRAARWLSEQTGVPAIELPYTVGGAPDTDDLFGLFEVTVTRLTGTAP